MLHGKKRIFLPLNADTIPVDYIRKVLAEGAGKGEEQILIVQEQIKT